MTVYYVCRVFVAVKRVGGAFGAKIFRSHQIAAASAIAAYHTRKSVSSRLLIEIIIEIFINSRNIYKYLYNNYNDRRNIMYSWCYHVIPFPYYLPHAVLCQASEDTLGP